MFVRPFDVDLFLSYNHDADRALAPAVQRGLTHLAKPWNQPRALRVFRDRTDLAAAHDLTAEIENALRRARFFLLLASPQAAASPWVAREIAYWQRYRSPETFLIAVTSGVVAWRGNDFDWTVTTALPRSLSGWFAREPIWEDLSFAHDRDKQSLRYGEFRSAVASLAAPVRGVPKQELDSEDVRRHRIATRLARAAVAGLTLLLVGALVLAGVAAVQKNTADRQARLALSRQLAATADSLLPTNVRSALLLAVRAYRIDANPQTLGALLRADTASPALVRYLPAGAAVQTLVGSADGSAIAAGLADGRVELWRRNRLSQPVFAATLHGPASGVAVDADGGVLAATDGSSVVLWHADGHLATVALPPGQQPDAVAVSPSGAVAAVHSRSPGFETPQSMSIVDTATGSVRAVQPASNTAAGASLVLPTDDEVLIFDPGYGTWERRRIADWSVLAASTVGFGVHQQGGRPSGNGQFVTGSNGSSTIPVWQTTGPTDPDHPALTALADITRVSALTLSRDGSALAVAEGGDIYLAPVAPANAIVPAAPIVGGFDSPTPGPVRAPTVHLHGTPPVTANSLLDFLGDDRNLVSATGSQIALWNLDQVDRLSHTSPMSMGSLDDCGACGDPTVSIAPDDSAAAIVSGASTRTIVAPLAGSSHPAANLPAVHGVPLWTADNRLTLVADKSSPSRGTSVDILPGGDGTVPILAADRTADGSTVLALDDRGDVFARDARTGDLRHLLPGPLHGTTGDFTDGAVDARAGLVVLVGNDGVATVYDVVTHRPPHTVPGHDIAHVAFAGDQLLVMRASGSLEVWDDTGSRPIRTIGGDSNDRRPPIPDHTGTLVARDRLDGTIALTDIATGTTLDTIPYTSPTRPTKVGVAFSPDGRYLVSANIDLDTMDTGTLIQRDISPDGLIRDACAAAASEFTDDEWRALVGASQPHTNSCR